MKVDRNGVFLNKLNGYLKRTNNYKSLDIENLLKDLIYWNDYKNIGIRWAQNIIGQYEDDIKSESESES